MRDKETKHECEKTTGLLWDMFTVSGNAGYYLLYRELNSKNE